MPFDLSILFRRPPGASAQNIVRAAIGAMLGVAATGLAARAILGGGAAATPLLVAPVGASAVLAFAIPASPLAQPRAIIGGNLISGLVGVACAAVIHPPLLAVGVAVGLAILMSLLGCLHPPGGAIALGAALAGQVTDLSGIWAALAPIGACSVLLALAAALYHNLTGHSYPHRPPPPVNTHATRDPPPVDRVGFTPQDVDAALAHYGELLDVSVEDLDALFREVELQAHQRIHKHILCGEIMSRDVISLDLEQTAESALAFLQQHDLRAAPVIDENRRVVGMARRAELLAARGLPVSRALDPFVHKVTPGTPIEALLPLLSNGAAHEAMVVDADRALVGVITQTDLLAVLYRAHIVEAVAAGGASQPNRPDAQR